MSDLIENTRLFVDERLKQEYREYLQTEDWQWKRGVCLEYYRHSCALCNGRMDLQVHHRTYDRLYFELPSDLIVLCDRCHKKFHGILPDVTSLNGWRRR